MEQDTEVAAMTTAVDALGAIEAAIKSVEGAARTDVLTYVERRVKRTLATYQPAKATRNGRKPK